MENILYTFGAFVALAIVAWGLRARKKILQKNIRNSIINKFQSLHGTHFYNCSPVSDKSILNTGRQDLSNSSAIALLGDTIVMAITSKYVLQVYNFENITNQYEGTFQESGVINFTYKKIWFTDFAVMVQNEPVTETVKVRYFLTKNGYITFGHPFDNPLPTEVIEISQFPLRIQGDHEYAHDKSVYA